MGKRKGERKTASCYYPFNNGVVDCSSGLGRVPIMSSDLGVAQGFASLQFVKKNRGFHGSLKWG